MNPIKFHIIIRKQRFQKFLKTIPQRIFWGKDYQKWCVQYYNNMSIYSRWGQEINYCGARTQANLLRKISYLKQMKLEMSIGYYDNAIEWARLEYIITGESEYGSIHHALTGE